MVFSRHLTTNDVSKLFTVTQVDDHSRKYVRVARLLDVYPNVNTGTPMYLFDYVSPVQGPRTRDLGSDHAWERCFSHRNIRYRLRALEKAEKAAPSTAKACRWCEASMVRKQGRLVCSDNCTM